MTDTEQPDAPDRASLIPTFREQPRTVADAFERLVRIDALAGWLGDVRDNIREGYIGPAADAVEASTGGSFRAPVSGLGVIYRDDPKAKPIITDREAFARWYVTEILDRDPDEAEGAREHPFTAEVERRLTATADPADLLAFLDDFAVATQAQVDGEALAVAQVLADRIDVEVEWILSGTLLDDLLGGKIHAYESGTARLRLVNDDDVIDRETGESVPGITVQPPRDPRLTVKPDKDAKIRIRAELDDLLGPPALRT